MRRAVPTLSVGLAVTTAVDIIVDTASLDVASTKSLLSIVCNTRPKIKDFSILPIVKLRRVKVKIVNVPNFRLSHAKLPLSGDMGGGENPRETFEGGLVVNRIVDAAYRPIKSKKPENVES